MKKFRISFTLIGLLLITTFFKELIFTVVIPIWHTPDEQAHFAQVAFFGELNRMPFLDKYDLNREIYESERLLGTLRDERGNNKFTFHPEYRIEYTNSLEGKYEREIADLPKEYRKELVRQEAANYPPLYYLLAALPYRIFYEASLIDRVFAARFVSIILGVITVYIAYLISKELFPKNPLLQISLPTLVSFQPMFSYLVAGVNSDNLMNMLFSLLLYISVLMISRGFKVRFILGSLLTLILLYLTKPQFVLGVPIFFLAIVITVFLKKGSNRYFKYSLFPLLAIGGVLVFLLSSNRAFSVILQSAYSQNFFPEQTKYPMSFITFFKQTLHHTIAEVIPWYWGVFNWLGVVLPRDVNRVINRIMIIAGVGVLVKLILILKKRSKEDIIFLFLVITAAIYFMGITYYNYLFALNHGFPFGIQGRYYFPTIIPHMTIILIGLLTVVQILVTILKKVAKKTNPSILSIQDWTVKGLLIAMIVLNFIALHTIAQSYYDQSLWKTFIMQISQYKPLIYKGFSVTLFLAVYLTLSIIFVYKIVSIKHVKTEGVK